MKPRADGPKLQRIAAALVSVVGREQAHAVVSAVCAALTPAELVALDRALDAPVLHAGVSVLDKHAFSVLLCEAEEAVERFVLEGRKRADAAYYAAGKPGHAYQDTRHADMWKAVTVSGLLWRSISGLSTDDADEVVRSIAERFPRRVKSGLGIVTEFMLSALARGVTFDGAGGIGRAHGARCGASNYSTKRTRLQKLLTERLSRLARQRARSLSSG